MSERADTVPAVRLIVARCEVRYTGRLTAVLPESTRLLMFKSDGAVLVHADAGGYKPLNWMTPPTAIEEDGERILVRKRAGKTEDCLEIRLIEVLSDVSHEMGEAAGLEKDGVERDLQEVLADAAGGARRGAAARPARVADRHRPCRPDVPRPRGRLGGGRGEAHRGDRGGRAARPLPRADPARPGAGRLPGRARRDAVPAAGGDARGVAGASAASRSTSRCCAASASPS